MDSDTLQVLVNAELEKYIPAFEEQAIGWQALKHLQISDLRPVFDNKLGLAAKFIDHLQRYKQNRAFTDKENTFISPAMIKPGECVIEPTNIFKSEDILGEPAEDPLFFPTSPDKEPAGTDTRKRQLSPVNLTPRKRMATTCADDDNVLLELLKTSAIGKGLLCLATKKASLSSANRLKLCTEIITLEMGGDPNKVIQKDRLEKLVEGVLKLFPKELKSTYYIPRKPACGHAPSVAPKGMLYDKYHNLLKFLRQTGVRRSRGSEHTAEDEDEPVPVDATLEGAYQWLEAHSSTDEQTAVLNWQKTREDRLNKLRKIPVKRDSTELQEYWRKYDFVTKPWGMTLHLSDFDHLHKDYNPLVSNWQVVQAKLRLLLKDYKAVKVDEIAEDDYIGILRLIPHFFNQPPLVGKKPRKTKDQTNPKVPYWKPNKEESRNGFLLHVKDQAQLDLHVRGVKEECQKVGKGLQPFPAVIGDDHNLISVLWINDEQFTVTSPLTAVDSCFKLYHVLHADYPCQSSYAWQFLQQAVYGIKTQWDFEAPNVTRVVRDYENLTL